jgi:hypothetical protein
MQGSTHRFSYLINSRREIHREKKKSALIEDEEANAMPNVKARETGDGQYARVQVAISRWF